MRPALPIESSASTAALVAAVAIAMLAADPAQAYIGPGAGLTAIGTMLALVAALLLAIVGFIWYPLKRLLRRRAKPADVKGEEPPH